MSVKLSTIFSVAIMAFFLACAATSPAPQGFRYTPEEVQKLAIGAWTRADGKTLSADGELLAVDKDFIYLEQSGQITLFPTSCLKQLTVAAYEGYSSTPGIVGTVGSLSTLSHGLLLMLTLPVWALSTPLLSYAQSKAGYMDFENKNTPNFDKIEVRKWARFPQGLPPDYFSTATGIRKIDLDCSDFVGHSPTENAQDRIQP
jgi:hypothetical protein